MFAGKNRFSINEERNLPLDVFYISILGEKYRGSKFPVLAGTINALVFLIRSWFTDSENSSIIYVLRKNDNQ